jgi:hypothetical protein
LNYFEILKNMFEILQNFELISRGLKPVLLLGIGLAGITVGLFLWLGGLKFKKILISIIAASAGYIFGIYIIDANFIVSIIIAAVAVSAALLIERAFISIMTALLITAVSFVVLSRSYFDDSISMYSVPDTQPAEGTTLNFRESLERLKLYFIDSGENIKNIASKLPFYIDVFLAAIASVCIVAGYLLRNLTCAFCCSALGTLSIFAGMITLLLFKGAEPVEGISNRPSIYISLIAAMTAFGTFEQLVLCRPLKAKGAGANPESKDSKNRSKK